LRKESTARAMLQFDRKKAFDLPLRSFRGLQLICKQLGGLDLQRCLVLAIIICKHVRKQSGCLACIDFGTFPVFLFREQDFGRAPQIGRKIDVFWRKQRVGSRRHGALLDGIIVGVGEGLSNAAINECDSRLFFIRPLGQRRAIVFIVTSIVDATGRIQERVVGRISDWTLDFVFWGPWWRRDGWTR